MRRIIAGLALIAGITSFISGTPFTPTFSTVDGQDITGSSEGARITADKRIGHAVYV